MGVVYRVFSKTVPTWLFALLSASAQANLKSFFKNDLEIAEIIEVNFCNHHKDIDILLLHRGRKIISMLKVATLTCSQLFLNQFSKFLHE